MQHNRGQSIIELIIAMAIGTVLMVGGVSAIIPILKISDNVARIQTASALGKELLENARVLADSNWHAIDSLSVGSDNKYYIIDSESPFTVATGTEDVVVATTTYSRYLYLEDVYRRATAPFEPGIDDAYDPSTKKITVVYTWPTNSSNTMVSYLTRTGNNVLFHDDWTRGGNQTNILTVTSTDDSFATSSNIDYSGTPGSVVITGF